MKYRYTVLTYNIDHYEMLHEVMEKDPEAEYIYVTDDPELKSETWTVVYDNCLEELSVFDKCYAIRFNPFKYCHSDICLRIDGSISIIKSLKPLIDIFENGNFDMALMPHSWRDNLIEEYQIWVNGRGYDARQAEHCINDMRERGYDFRYRGLFQLCFSIQRNDETTRELNSRTLKYLKELGHDGTIERLDQIPFSYIMNTYYSDKKVMAVSEQIIRSPFMQWYYHNSNTPNVQTTYDLSKKDVKYMFNKEVECLYLFPSNQTDMLNRIQYLEKELLKEQQNNSPAKLFTLYMNYSIFKIVYKMLRAYRKHIRHFTTY